MRIELSLEQNITVCAAYLLTPLIFSFLVHCLLKRMLSSLLFYYFLKTTAFHVPGLHENLFSTYDLMHESNSVTLLGS